MAFSWILGRRSKPVAEASPEEVNPLLQEAGHEGGDIDLTEIKLSIEDGLVMAFSPKGDPISPSLLKETRAKQPLAEIRLPDGVVIDQKRLIDVIDAQQKSPLAEKSADNWVRAMLGAEGSFEPATAEQLASEEAEGKSMLGGKLILDMPGGETITLRDAHPGDARHEQPAKLLLDGKPLSIGEALRKNDEKEASVTLSSLPNPVVTQKEGAITLLWDDGVEAKLEQASSAWEGEAKVELFLKDGRQVSIDDVMTLLQNLALPEDRMSEADMPVRQYPLLADLESPFDLTRATIVRVSGMPDGWSLTAGIQSEQGAWMLDPSDLMETSVQVAGLQGEASSLEIDVISIVGHDGSLKKQTRTVVISPLQGDVTATSIFAPAPDDEPPSAYRLEFGEAETSLAISADALLLLGIPDGVSLSAGTFDPSVGGWVLKPSELGDLVMRDLDRHVGTIEIELKAIHLDQGRQPRADVISKRTIDVAA